MGANQFYGKSLMIPNNIAKEENFGTFVFEF